MAANMGRLVPLKRESHPAYSAGWLPMCQLAGCIENDTVEGLRFQALVHRHRVAPDTAGVLTRLVFGEVDHD